MKSKKVAIEIVEKLKKYYPDATCSLDFKTPFQMVIAVMLSAQCTDERVNKTTPALFERCKRVLEENDGRMLICGNEMSAYDLEYVSDELSALKLLSI